MKNRLPKKRNDLSTKAKFNQSQGKKKKEKPKRIESYEGYPVDSMAEAHTLMYFLELQKGGFIKNIRRSESYMLFDTVTKNWIRHLVTKSVPEVETLLSSHLYTPDFYFELTDKGRELPLFVDINSTKKLREFKKYNILHQDGKVHIETKGTNFRHKTNTQEKFSVDSKWIWEKHKIFVNLFIPCKVFPLTFTPTEYLFTDVSRQLRKIDWKIRTMYEYIKAS